jgi:predicted AlkP superfamily phosphohydrolase/phosphomutase
MLHYYARVASPQMLIIGLDGATWRLFEPWARDGRFPALASLMARGTWGRLRSTVPAVTLPAWSSFMTGKNPGGHGVYGFRRLPFDRYDGVGLANARDLRAATIWDVAAAAGRRVGVINVPPSYPLRPIPQGYVVGCMLTPPGQAFTSPPEVARELGDYEIDLQPPKNLRRGDPDYRARALAYLHGMARQTRLRGDATVRVMRARPTDAVCVVFYAPDRVQHYFWEYVDPERTAPPPNEPDVAAAVLSVYAALDRAVATLLAAVGPETAIVVLSDHGFGAKPERSVRVNRWLADRGYLRRRPFWTLRRRVVRKVLPEPWRTKYDTTDFILLDRARSRAWAESLFTGTSGVFVNVRGRYPLGCVAPGAEYERVRDEIHAGLSALQDEAGHRVFRGVWRREELYQGPFVAEAPDIVLECAPRFGVLFESLRREIRQPDLFGPFEELGYTGTHDQDGLYVLAGGPFAAGGHGDPLSIEAIAPTVLYGLGVPIPRDFEAEPYLGAVRPEHIASAPPQFQDPMSGQATADGDWRSEADEEQVAEHLRALGYLE